MHVYIYTTYIWWDGRCSHIFLSWQQDSKSILFQFSRNQIIPSPHPPPQIKKKPNPSAVLVHFQSGPTFGIGPSQFTAQAVKNVKNINIKLLVLMHHILTHARFAIWISIDLSIVLYNWETGRQRSNFLFALFWTGAAARVLTTTIITVKHPEWIASFPFCSWSMFCLQIKKKQTKNHNKQKPQRIAEHSEYKYFKVKLKNFQRSKSAFKSRCTNKLLYQHRRMGHILPIKLVLVESKLANFLYCDIQEEKSISWSTENTQ